MRRGALLRYLAVWAVAAAAAAGLAILALSGGEDDVSLPPVRETQLADAARTAGCEVRRGGERLRPPVAGRRATAARPAVYTRTPADRSLVGAIRRGIIVIHYRPPLAKSGVDQLRRLHDAVPVGTIVTPYPRMRYGVTVTAWRRLLGCRRVDARTVEAIRLFQGRYIGSGPDG